MAADWIAMRVDLPDEPEVIRMAGILNIEIDSVVGKLLRVWGWFDTHTADGNAPGVTEAFLDRFAGAPGFAKAMRSVGWLDGPADGVAMPHFERYTGSSAKKRVQTNRRVAKFRGCNAPSVTESVTTEQEQDKTEPLGNTTTATATVPVSCDQILAAAVAVGSLPSVGKRGGLTDEQARCFNAIIEKPDWCVGAWVEHSMAKALAKMPTTNMDVIRYYLSVVKDGRATLDNPAGLFIKGIRCPDPPAVERYRIKTERVRARMNGTK